MYNLELQVRTHIHGERAIPGSRVPPKESYVAIPRLRLACAIAVTTCTLLSVFSLV